MDTFERFQGLEESSKVFSQTWQSELLVNSHQSRLVPKLKRTESQTVSKSSFINIQNTQDSDENSKSFQGMCKIHWGQKSEYLVQKGQESIQICKKCAVRFASRGIVVKHLIRSVPTALDDDTKQKFVEQYIKKMEIDCLLTKMKITQKKYNEKKQRLKTTVLEHEKSIQNIKLFYSVLKKKILKNLNEVNSTYERYEERNSQWKIRTSQAVINIEKVIKDLETKILKLSFDDPQTANTLQSNRFYKDALIFYDYESQGLEQETYDIQNMRKLNLINKAKALFVSSSSIAQNTNYHVEN